MNDGSTPPLTKRERDAAELREQAEKRLAELAPGKPVTPEETSEVLHELRVHQIELEMQNEQLRATQQELEASRARYSELYDLAPVGYVTLDEEGSIVEANLAIARLFGVERALLKGRRLTEFVHSDDQDELYLHQRRLTHGALRDVCTVRLTRPTEEPPWVRLESTQSPGIGVQPSQSHVAISDISAQKRGELALRESEERLRTVFVAAREGIALQLRDGRLSLWNAAAEKLFGVSETDVVGQSALGRDWRAFHEDGSPWPPADHPSMRTLATGRPLSDVLMGVERSGEMKWITVNTQPILRPGESDPYAVTITFSDYTAKRRAEQELLRERDRAQSYLDIAGVMLVAIGTDQKTLLVNPKACEILGRDESEVVGANWFDLALPEADRERVRDVFAQCIAENVAPAERFETALVTASGEHRLIAWHNTVIRNADGSVAATLSSGEDITEQRRNEDEIRQLNAELQERVVSRTEQLDAATRELEAFAYSIAHDIRAPLRAIDGFSAMVIEDESERLSPVAVDHLERVRTAAQTLGRLIDDVMGLSSMARRDLQRQTVDVSRVATEVAAEIVADAPTRVVELEVQPGLTASADPALTRLILRELLDNAWKFTYGRECAHVEVGALDADGERAFFVRDDGAGFDMRYAAHLFGVFQRMHTAEQFEGDGVGLATVQRLVRRHGGRVWAEAEPDKGATIFFTLPEPATEP